VDLLPPAAQAGERPRGRAIAFGPLKPRAGDAPSRYQYDSYSRRFYMGFGYFSSQKQATAAPFRRAGVGLG
jgi:hypothetical protein